MSSSRAKNDSSTAAAFTTLTGSLLGQDVINGSGLAGTNHDSLIEIDRRASSRQALANNSGVAQNKGIGAVWGFNVLLLSPGTVALRRIRSRRRFALMSATKISSFLNEFNSASRCSPVFHPRFTNFVKVF
jgi:hypothetical protein